MRPAWHALFAPLPQDAILRRKPVASPEQVATGEAAAIAGWEQLSIELTAGLTGMRHVMVVLDAAGTPISAGDWVMYRSEGRNEIVYTHENVGGRIEPDGRFLGTRWRTVAVEKAGSDEAETKEMVKSEPTPEDVAALMALVKELLSR